METHTLYHGTSWRAAEIIKRDGFKPSDGGCLGPGTYVARADKASKFASNCSRHGGDAGAVVEVRITFTRAKYVSYDDHTWIAEGYDACRAERTSWSPHPEWCVRDASQVMVREIRRIDCGSELPAFEGEALSLGAVRHLARNSGLKEICFNGKDAVVSFAAGVGTCSVRRHDVYFQTGTVCSSFKHPRQGQTHIVRRKVDTVSIELLFRDGLSQCCGASDGPCAGSKRSTSDCECHGRCNKARRGDGAQQPAASLAHKVNIACPELAGEWRPATPDLWTRPAQAHDHRTVERWDAMGRCQYQTGDDSGVIAVISKCTHPLTGLLEYKCKGITGSACRAPQLILRSKPDGSRTWDLGAWGVEHWKRVSGSDVIADEAPMAAGDEETVVRAALDKLRREVAETEAVLEDHRRRREEKERAVAELRRKEEEARQREVQRMEEEAWRREEAQGILARQQQELAKAQQLRERGAHWLMKLSLPGALEYFKARCGTAEKFKTVKHVAVFDGGIFISRDNGNSSWYNLPDGLHRRLVSSNKNTTGALKYVAGGPTGAYYAELATGDQWWDTQGLRDADLFDTQIRGKGKRACLQVEFGEDGTWIVLFQDGSFSFSGGLPTPLYNKLRSRNRRLPPASGVTLGPNESWFVRWKDGKTEWELPAHVSDVCNAVRAAGGDVTHVSLFSHEDYLVRSTVSVKGQC